MTKTVMAALMMALALTACHRADNNPSSAGSTSSAAPASSSGTPSGLSGLGGSTKK